MRKLCMLSNSTTVNIINASQVSSSTQSQYGVMNNAIALGQIDHIGYGSGKLLRKWYDNLISWISHYFMPSPQERHVERMKEEISHNRLNSLFDTLAQVIQTKHDDMLDVLKNHVDEYINSALPFEIKSKLMGKIHVFLRKHLNEAEAMAVVSRDTDSISKITRLQREHQAYWDNPHQEAREFYEIIYDPNNNYVKTRISLETVEMPDRSESMGMSVDEYTFQKSKEDSHRREVTGNFMKNSTGWSEQSRNHFHPGDIIGALVLDYRKYSSSGNFGLAELACHLLGDGREYPQKHFCENGNVVGFTIFYEPRILAIQDKLRAQFPKIAEFVDRNVLSSKGFHYDLKEQIDQLKQKPEYSQKISAVISEIALRQLLEARFGKTVEVLPGVKQPTSTQESNSYCSSDSPTLSNALPVTLFGERSNLALGKNNTNQTVVITSPNDAVSQEELRYYTFLLYQYLDDYFAIQNIVKNIKTNQDCYNQLSKIRELLYDDDFSKWFEITKLSARYNAKKAAEKIFIKAYLLSKESSYSLEDFQHVIDAINTSLNLDQQLASHTYFYTLIANVIEMSFTLKQPIPFTTHAKTLLEIVCNNYSCFDLVKSELLLSHLQKIDPKKGSLGYLKVAESILYMHPPQQRDLEKADEFLRLITEPTPESLANIKKLQMRIHEALNQFKTVSYDCLQP